MIKNTPTKIQIRKPSTKEPIQAKGTFINEQYNPQDIDCEPIYTFGIQDVQFYLPSLGIWLQSSNNFVIDAPTLSSAKAIFWDKWRSYINRRFHTNYIQIIES
jgi:hypothetical protein